MSINPTIKCKLIFKYDKANSVPEIECVTLNNCSQEMFVEGACPHLLPHIPASHYDLS